VSLHASVGVAIASAAIALAACGGKEDTSRPPSTIRAGSRLTAPTSGFSRSGCLRQPERFGSPATPVLYVYVCAVNARSSDCGDCWGGAL
jgi:hypothetical protein